MARPKVSDRQMSLRVRQTDIDRAEALVAALEATELGVAGEVKRSTVLRLAIARGLDALEDEYGPEGERG